MTSYLPEFSRIMPARRERLTSSSTTKTRLLLILIQKQSACGYGLRKLRRRRSAEESVFERRRSPAADDAIMMIGRDDSSGFSRGTSQSLMLPSVSPNLLMLCCYDPDLVAPSILMPILAACAARELARRTNLRGQR